jgi:hypothetical protein
MYVSKVYAPALEATTPTVLWSGCGHVDDGACHHLQKDSNPGPSPVCG